MTTNIVLGTLLHLSWEKYFVKAHNHLPKGTQPFSQEHGSQGNTTIFQKQLPFPKGNSLKKPFEDGKTNSNLGSFI
jgi:hypothetical protein